MSHGNVPNGRVERMGALARRALPVRAAVLATVVLSGCEMTTLASITGAVFPRSSPGEGLPVSGIDRLLDDLSPASLQCLRDGDRIGRWHVRYAGFGCVRSVEERGRHLLTLRPKGAESPETTHAALMVGPALPSHYLLRTDLRTTRQLRTGSPPNAWEVGWLVWNYVDDEHFYYFIPKPDGWELGKRDPAYPGGQRFLATGVWPSHPPGEWHTVEVIASPGRFRIRAAGLDLVDFVDDERPYPAGRIALYTEDAEIQARDMTLIW